MPLIEITNHGPLILATSYWDSEIERAGKVFASVNAGAIRLLMPRSLRALINEWRAADYAILSRGPWPEMQQAEAVEIVWEDHTDSPHAIHLTPESFDSLPAEPPPGREWIVSVWDLKKDRPHKALERPCYWRAVPCLPWLRPWPRR